MKRLVETLKENNLTIASCESLTGGLFASKIVEVSGASSVFVGGYVTYMDKCKEILLNGQDILHSKGAISEEMAYLMAKEVKEKLVSDIAVSFTGNAGPFASEGKEVGLVYSCIIFKEEYIVYKDLFSGNRNEIRESVINKTVERLFTFLKRK